MVCTTIALIMLMILCFIGITMGCCGTIKHGFTILYAWVGFIMSIIGLVEILCK